MNKYWQRIWGSRTLTSGIAVAAAVATIVACGGAADESTSELDQRITRTAPAASLGTVNDSGITVLKDSASLDVITGKCQWSTTDGSPTDVACCEGESSAADSGGGKVCVIGTHGNVGVIQCMPPDGVYADSGAEQLLCSICYAGAPLPDGGASVANCVAIQQGADCRDVIACTGSVSPRGFDGKRGCSVMVCNGSWVNGCNPPASIAPATSGICYDSATRDDDGGPTR